MNTFKILVLFALSSFSAHAQLLSDAGQSPNQKYDAGKRMYGVFNANDVLRCSPKAIADRGLTFFSDTTVLTVNGTLHTVASFLPSVSEIISKSMTNFVLGGDAMVGGHHLCIGFYSTGDVKGNAEANVDGYVQVDTQLYHYLYNLPQEKRSMQMLDFVILHEFSHAIQFWSNDWWAMSAIRRELKNVRHAELVADCMSAAQLGYQFRSYSDAIKQASIQGLLGAADSLADFEIDEFSHHGLPVERTLAVRMGLKKGLSYGTLYGITSKDILDHCNTQVSIRDLIEGENKWTIQETDKVLGL